jgi:autotransporter-associated beta strand protein
MFEVKERFHNMVTRQKEFGVLAAAMCFAAAFAATPDLPEAVNGVITLTGEYTLTEADAEAITNVTQFTLSSASTRIVFDLSEGASLHVPGLIGGAGKIVKRGKGALYLDNNTVGTAYKVTNGLLVEDGGLHLPEQPANYKTSDHFAIELNAPGVLFMTGSDTNNNNCRTVVNRLSGDGLITNAWAMNQTIETDAGTSDFYGKICGKLGNIYVYPSSTLNLRGVESTFTATVQSFGTIGLVKVGYDASVPSSMGCNGTLSLIPNDGSDYGRFVYLGPGETTVKTLAFDKWNKANAMTVDGGVTGGLAWNGPITVSDNHGVMNSVIFTGEHTNACEVGGSWTEPAGGATYVTKKGSGLWIFRHNAARAMKGVVDVKEGALQFESLAEKGTVCSLGLSTLTCQNILGDAFNEAYRVPYAFVLGGGTKGEATLECIGRASVTNVDAAAERPLVLAGAGRLKTSGFWPFSLKGVSSIAALPCTITLDGTNTLSALSTVTNGASALSVVKEGTGTWTLRGPLDFSGALAVKAGTLVVEGPDTPYSFFRLSINYINSNFNNLTDTCIGGSEFALYDADGIRRNTGLSVPATTVASAITLLPGQASIDEPLSKITSGSRGWFTNSALWLSNFFDENGSSTFYTAVNSGAPSYMTTSSWVTVSMRLASGSPAITSYDLMCMAGNTRRIWGYEVRGSTDGVAWDLLDEKGTNDCKQVTGQGWYSDGSSTVTGARHGFAITSAPAYAANVAQLARVSGVSVAAGATLKAKGTVTLPSLTLDCANGNGTLDGFAFADAGVVNLVNFTPGANVQNVPITFANTDAAALAKVNGRNWTVSVDGVVTRSKRVSISADHATVSTVGTVIFVQ